MQKNTYTLLLLLLAFLFSCKEEQDKTGPSITFVEHENNVFSDTVIALGQTIKVGIEAEMGSSNITLFQYKINSDGNIESVDSGVNTSAFSFSKNITKNASETEIWTFFVKDINGLSDEVSIYFTKSDEAFYGDILLKTGACFILLFLARKQES